MPGTKWGQRWGDPWGRSELRVTNLRAQRLADDPSAVELSWDYDAALDAEGCWFQVYRDGVRLCTTREKRIIIAGRPGEQNIFEVIDVGPLSGDPAYDLAWAVTLVPGNKVRLSWDQVSDAAAYAVFWDAGTGSMDYATPLVVIRDDGEARQSWLSGELANGVYKFCVRSRDAAGNQSANTAFQMVEVASWPKPPVGLALVYSDPNINYGTEEEPVYGDGTVTLTWQDPPGLAPESGDRIRIYQGELAIPGGGDPEWDANLGVWPDVDYSAPSAEVEIGVQIWISGVLDLATIHVFALRSYAAGLDAEERNVDVAARLELTDLDATARPPKPEGVTVTAIAGGRVRVAGFIPALREGQVAPVQASIYYDTSLVNLLAGSYGGVMVKTLIATTGGWAFIGDSSVLTDGALYYFLARAQSMDARSAFAAADVASATADSTLPTAPANQAAAAERGGEG